ncbi:MAG TPA: hypothetical protein VG649_09480 [Candidatus Angelobacter sp.]|jgi:hypothetical protein|nr:hypothetical protein [Candidatus Angelobacter sp.]
MSDIPFTVNTLLGLPDREFCEQVLAAGADQEEPDSIKERVAKGLRGLQWKAVEGEVRRKAGELLNIDVMGLIASAWREGKVMGRLEEGNKSREGTAHIPLQQHTIESELEPYIEIQFGSLSKKIVLNVKIEIKLSGLILKIEDSKIKAIEAGSVTGTGDINIKKVRLLRRGFGPIDLPAKVNLGNGIPLGKSANNGGPGN